MIAVVFVVIIVLLVVLVLGFVVTVVVAVVVDVWVVVGVIEEDGLIVCVVYPFHCHQSNGPAGGYQGVGNGKVVLTVDVAMDEDPVEVVVVVVVVVENVVLLFV